MFHFSISTYADGSNHIWGEPAKLAQMMTDYSEIFHLRACEIIDLTN
jgi:hypothetical protein